MSFPFTLKPTFVPVVNAARKRLFYPVRRIYCIGQNYEGHAREVGGFTSKNNPFFFTKPGDSLVTLDIDPQDSSIAFPSTANANLTIRYPSVTESYHHEVELVVAVGPRQTQQQQLSFFNIPVEVAHEAIYAYGVGLDMTRRDLQAQAKENGKPWDLAKGGDDSAVMSPLMLATDYKAAHPSLFESFDYDADTRDGFGDGVRIGAASVAESVNVKNGAIYLSVNARDRQKGNMNCMVNTPAEIISILSKYVTLHAGDLIFTGTPSGVGPVRRGDEMTAGIEGIGEINVKVV